MFLNRIRRINPAKKDQLTNDLLELINDAKVHVFKVNGSIKADDADRYAVQVSDDFTQKLVIYMVAREQKIAEEFYKRGRENCDGVCKNVI